ncbi:MAG: DUF2155 domain-containing protein [Pseudomonadota bacterium]
MAMKLFTVGSAAALMVFSTSATGQEPPAPVGADPALDAILSPGTESDEAGAAPAAAPLSELDLLSRAEDDPFSQAVSVAEREPVSVTLRALNKITARYTDLEIAMNEIARFGSLEIQPRTCDKRPPEEFPETSAFLEIFDIELNRRVSNLKPGAHGDRPVEGAPEDPSSVRLAAQTEPPADAFAAYDEAVKIAVANGDATTGDAVSGRSVPGEAGEFVSEGPVADGVNIFRGWMFASSPALNPLEHGVYDVWVIDCKTRVIEN